MLAIALLALAQRPNVILLRTDDQDLASFSVRRPDGSALLRETTRGLVRRGIRFTHSVTSAPLCSPSRASVLTGQYAHNHGVLTNDPPLGGYGALDHSNTLAVWLDRAGYSTCHVGKYMNGYGGTGIPPGWDEWYTSYNSRYFDYSINENGTVVPYGSSPGDYHTDVIARKAIDFVRRMADAGQRFFLVVDFIAPHKTSPPILGSGSVPIPAPRHAGTFANYVPQVSPSYDEMDVSDKPAPIQALPPISSSAADEILVDLRARYETLMAVDDAVGRILAALEAVGIDDQTYVVFTADNGFQQGEHRICTGKDYVYEESIRVPLIVSGPGVPRGLEIDRLVANVDIAPTIVGWTGCVPGRVMDGVSLQGLLGGIDTIDRRHVLLERFGDSAFRGLRSGSYLYAEHDYDQDSATDAIELYRLRADVHGAGDAFELDNLTSDPIYAALIHQFHGELLQLSGCSGAACQ